MKDITSPTWIKIKGLLFLMLGLMAVILLLLDNPTRKTAALLILAIWCFCRFYYFAFYVLEKYVDPGHRFSGLGSLLKYLLKRPGKKAD